MMLLSLNRSDTGRALLQWFSFFIAFGSSIQTRQVLKALGHIGMIGSQRFLSYLQ